jgi:hypothetical protein
LTKKNILYKNNNTSISISEINNISSLGSSVQSNNTISNNCAENKILDITIPEKLEFFPLKLINFFIELKNKSCNINFDQEITYTISFLNSEIESISKIEKVRIDPNQKKKLGIEISNEKFEKQSRKSYDIEVIIIYKNDLNQTYTEKIKSKIVIDPVKKLK